MIKEVRALGIALKDKDGGICKFVNTDVFDKRRKQVSIFSNPFSNLHNDMKLYNTVIKKLEAKKTLGNYEIVLAEYVVNIDLSLIYKEGLAKIDKVQGNSVRISLVGGSIGGYQIFNKDKCIINKEIKEYQYGQSDLLVA